MGTQITGTLFDAFQKEFGPTIDSSLIAALLVELESDSNGNSVVPTQDQIDSLRSTLNELSLHAEESQHSELSDFQLTSQADDTISSWTTPDGNGSSGSSVSSAQSFSSPLGFLQAALPEIPVERLRKALEDIGQDDAEMWDVVANILTEEYIQELEERGLKDEDDFLDEFRDDSWETVEKKSFSKAPKKKSPSRARKFTLLDIRQQHHLPTKTNGLKTKGPPSGSTDPWTQITSISEYVSSLLPSHPPSYFQSFFHSPKHTTSYEALRSALVSISPITETENAHVEVLYTLLDIIMPEYEDSDPAQRNRIISDVQLAIQVTNGKGDEALDLVYILRDLDSNTDLGVYHTQPNKPNKALFVTSSAPRASLPAGPPSIPPPPSVRVRQKADSTPNKHKPSPYQWQAVPERKVPQTGPHPLAHHIPAYTRDVNGNKTSRAAGIRGVSSTSAVSTEFRRRMNESMRKRNEALREASRMWQKGRGNSKTHGGEIAFYFAERARELQEVARTEALNAARAMILEKRSTSGILDLHGTTVSEAVVIVKEILKAEGPSISPAKPLKIITGRGSHSLNNVSVLKPAVRKALLEDGWSVGSWDGGLIVRQKRM